MLHDSITLTEGSSVTNLTIDSGTSFPANPNVGELFYRSDESLLFIHSGTTWNQVGSSLDFDGLTVKAPVKAATTANITLSGTQVIDTISLIAGDRVLVKNQTNAVQNGVYVVAAGAWTRSTDFDDVPDSEEVTAGAFMFVTQGAVNGSTGWVLNTPDPVQVGTTGLSFGQFTGAFAVADGPSGSVQLSNGSGTFTSTAQLLYTDPGGQAEKTLRVGEATSPLLMKLGGNTKIEQFDGQSTLTVGADIITQNNAPEVSLILKGASGPLNAGGVQLIAGSTSGTNSSAGNVLIKAGNTQSNFAFTGGHVVIESGTANTTGGSIFFWTPGTTTPAERMRIAPTGALGFSGANFGTAGQVLTSAGPSATPSWQPIAASAGTSLNGTALFNTSPQNTTGLYAGMAADTVPALYFTNTGAPAGQRNSRVYSQTVGGSMLFTFVNDANNAETAWMTVNRSGTTASNVTIATNTFNLTGLNSGLQINGTAGTAGQVLTSNGNAAPTWQSQSTAITLTTAAQPNVTSLGTLTSLAVAGNVTAADPSAFNHLTTKSYVDNLVAGLSWKNAVDAATTANITLSGTQTIDGVSVTAGMRVLVKDQSTASQNGVYVVAAGAWTRATDFDSVSPIDEINSAAVFVKAGTVNADTSWTQTAHVVTVDTDPLTFTIFSALGGALPLTGGTITGDLVISKNIDGLTGIQIVNNSTGASASSDVIVTNDANQSLVLEMTGSNYTGFPGQGWIATSSGSLNLQAAGGAIPDITIFPSKRVVVGGGADTGFKFAVNGTAKITGNTTIEGTLDIAGTINSTSDAVIDTGVAGGAIRLDASGRLSGTKLHNNSSLPTGTTEQYIASGTYTPTLTAITNVSNPSAISAQWMRVGNVVNVSGAIFFQTGAGSTTEMDISLPIPSALATTGQLAGTVASSTGTATVSANAADDRAKVFALGTLPPNGNHTVYFTFMYVIV